MTYTIDELKRAAASGKPLQGMTKNESVVFYTYRYCYRTYRKNPTEETKQRLEAFVKPTVERCMRADEEERAAERMLL